jgi:hypothetical protein
MTLQPLVPSLPLGTVDVTPTGIDPARRDEDLALRDVTLQTYAAARIYYAGQQYDEENDTLWEALGYKGKGMRLPEHLRKHAYSSHIQEAIDVLADMLSEGVQFSGEYADELNEAWGQAEMDERNDDWFRDSLICGDVYAIPEFDPFLETMRVDVWEAESIWPVYDQNDWRRLDHYYRFRTFADEQGEHQEERVTVLQPFQTFAPSDSNPTGVVYQAVEYTFVDEELSESRPLMLPFLPLVHGRGDTRNRLRSRFGDSMITRKVRGSADRYNSLGQLGFRVARQNSFATLAVVGDAANLGAGRKEEGIAKDIADVLTFPGGTDLKAITLPTDPRMIDSQTRLLEKNLYKEFGLTKIDMEDMTGMGTVSGYALEVLNRKDRATHERVRKNAKAGIRALANMMLDIKAIREAQAQGTPWWEVDPDAIYPNRAGIQVVVGSGDIVDTTSDRDDYTAGVVSRKYVLRRKGMSDGQIDAVEAEIETEKRFASELATQAANTQAEHSAQLAIEQAKATASVRPTGTQTGTTQQGG